MKTMVWLAACLAAVLLLLAGCDSDNEPSAIPRTGQALPILREFRGQQGSFADRGFFVVQRPEIWEALWANQQVPTVDFSRQSVLVALMGLQPTTGYDMRITDVRTAGQRVVVYVTQTVPPPSLLTIENPTTPYHMVVIPKIDQPVDLVFTGDTAWVIPILDGFQGTQSQAVAPQPAVIRDRQVWAKLWADNFGATMAVPEVDFAQRMAVAVFMGQRPTGGYSVMITSVERIDDRLVVNFRTRSPQPGDVVTQVITSPYAIAIIPASTLPVVFHDLTAPPAPTMAPIPPR